MEIKILKNKDEKGCQCEDWLFHWYRFSGQAPTYCPVDGCMNPIEIGARIEKPGKPDGKWFIVPLCLKHESQTGETFYMNDHVKLIIGNDSQALARMKRV